MKARLHSEASEDLNLQAVRFKSLRAKIQIFPKDNAKARHSGSGNARTVPHGSEKDRKGPVRGCFKMKPFVFLGTDYADYTDKL